jgi:hypothetical protein
MAILWALQHRTGYLKASKIIILMGGCKSEVLSLFRQISDEILASEYAF